MKVRVALEGMQLPALGSTLTVFPQALSTKGLVLIKLPSSRLKQDAQGCTVRVFDPAPGTVRSQPVVIPAAAADEAVVSQGPAPGKQVVSAGVHVCVLGRKCWATAIGSGTVSGPAKAVAAPGAGCTVGAGRSADPGARSDPAARRSARFQLVALGTGASGADALPDGRAGAAGIRGLLPPAAGRGPTVYLPDPGDPVRLAGRHRTADGRVNGCRKVRKMADRKSGYGNCRTEAG